MTNAKSFPTTTLFWGGGSMCYNRSMASPAHESRALFKAPSTHRTCSSCGLCMHAILSECGQPTAQPAKLQQPSALLQKKIEKKSPPSPSMGRSKATCTTRFQDFLDLGRELHCSFHTPFPSRLSFRPVSLSAPRFPPLDGRVYRVSRDERGGGGKKSPGKWQM